MFCSARLGQRASSAWPAQAWQGELYLGLGSRGRTGHCRSSRPGKVTWPAWPCAPSSRLRAPSPGLVVGPFELIGVIAGEVLLHSWKPLRRRKSLQLGVSGVQCLRQHMEVFEGGSIDTYEATIHTFDATASGLCKTRLLIHPRVPWPDSYESSRHASSIRSNGFSSR
jgi:hypothetical protein